MRGGAEAVGSRREGVRAAATYARIAVFAAACAVYALVLYAVLGRFRSAAGAGAEPRPATRFPPRGR
ncbi:MAG: hypothetical protein AAF726_08670 [Planctomycetota bacterium]